jgi:hypothetical protein
MVGSNLIRGYRLGFVALATIAIIVQGIQGATRDESAAPHPFSWGNFFSFFTIQSNIIAIVMLLLLATAWSDARTPQQTLIRGGATAWMMTTGVVYGLLLSGYQEALQTTLPWVDTVLHKVIPLVMVIDWIVDRPQHRLTMRSCLVWMLYPLAYLVYSLIRGPIVDWYPYPFLNPDEAGGYAGVAAYSVGITIGFLGFIWVIVTLANRPWENRTSRAT